MKYFTPTISDAIVALGIDGGFKIKDGKVAKWYSEKEQPSDDAIQEKLKELQNDFTSKQYQRDRQPEYPSIGDQLDMLFHAIDAGKVDKTSDFYKSLKAVKDKYPKG